VASRSAFGGPPAGAADTAAGGSRSRIGEPRRAADDRDAHRDIPERRTDGVSIST
jgi:hypothetical protein